MIPAGSRAPSSACGGQSLWGCTLSGRAWLALHHPPLPAPWPPPLRAEVCLEKPPHSKLPSAEAFSPLPTAVWMNEDKKWHSELEPSGSHSGTWAACHGISQERECYAIVSSSAMSAGICAIQHSTSSRTSWLIRNPHELQNAHSHVLWGSGTIQGFHFFCCVKAWWGLLDGSYGGAQWVPARICQGFPSSCRMGRFPFTRRQPAHCGAQKAGRRWSGPLPPAALAWADSALSL